jgi:uncharacterized phage protein (TIGR01671 family)
MKNNFKFRVWDTISKRFLISENNNGLNFTYSDNPINQEDYNLDLGVLISHCGEEVIINQYTGLHDKNGKEIFEGDILKMEWMKRGNFIIADVKYGSGGFYLPKYDFLNVSVKHDEIPDGEVIGNVFENPELLK